MAIARGYVAAGGIDLVCVPTFADIEIDGERRTAIRLVIEDETEIAHVEAILRDPEAKGETNHQARGNDRAEHDVGDVNYFISPEPAKHNERGEENHQKPHDRPEPGSREHHQEKRGCVGGVARAKLPPAHQREEDKDECSPKE